MSGYSVGTERVTAAGLRKLGACAEQVEIVERAWPGGVTVTLRALRRATALGLNLDWWAQRVLSPEARTVYRQALATASDAYEQATTPARDAYEQARATAWDAYRQATATAWATHAQAAAPALAAYRQAMATALAVYEQARAPALWRALSRGGRP